MLKVLLKSTETEPQNQGNWVEPGNVDRLYVKAAMIIGPITTTEEEEWDEEEEEEQERKENNPPSIIDLISSNDEDDDQSPIKEDINERTTKRQCIQSATLS